MNAMTDKPYAPKLGDDGEPCAECGTPLRADQRYCINCGRRRGDARLPFLEVLRDEYGGDRERDADSDRDAAKNEPKVVHPGVAAGVVGGLVLLLALGVLIGNMTGNKPKQVAAQAPVVVNGGGTGAQNAANTPGAGQSGSSGSNGKNSQKSSGGNPNIFSGHLKSGVIDKSQLEYLHHLTGKAYEQASRKLPDQTILTGKPPPTDNKPPGGGSGPGVTIK